MASSEDLFKQQAVLLGREIRLARMRVERIEYDIDVCSREGMDYVYLQEDLAVAKSELSCYQDIAQRLFHACELTFNPGNSIHLLGRGKIPDDKSIEVFSRGISVRGVISSEDNDFITVRFGGLIVERGMVDGNYVPVQYLFLQVLTQNDRDGWTYCKILGGFRSYKGLRYSAWMECMRVLWQGEE